MLDCIDIFWSLNSSKMFFYIIMLIKEKKTILNLEFKDNKEIIRFIPNKCFNFEKIFNSTNLVLIDDLKKYLINQNIIEGDENKYEFNFTDYWTLIYDDILFIFIKSPYKIIKGDNQNNIINQNSNNNSNGQFQRCIPPPAAPPWRRRSASASGRSWDRYSPRSPP